MPTENGRKKATEKSSDQKVKVKDITVTIEVPTPTDGGPTNPPPNGDYCWCSHDGIAGWVPK